MLLGLGVTWLGLIAPCLQMALAYLYFRKGNIWSRVLNAHLGKDGEDNTPRMFPNRLYMLKQLVTNRVLH